MENIEENTRNDQGRFVAGHKGLKPKGATNKQTREYLERVEWVLELLESNLEDNVNSLSKKEQIMLWVELQKLLHSKLPKIPEPVPEKEPITKITFEVVGSHKSDLDDPPAVPPPPSQKISAPVQPGLVRRDGSGNVPFNGNASTKQSGGNNFRRSNVVQRGRRY
jgi:hypothetical protein